MTDDHCPTNCREDRARLGKNIDELYGLSIPAWVRAIIISSIVAMCGWLVSLQTSSYSRAEASEDQRILRQHMIELLQQISTRLGRIEDKVDRGR